MALVGATDVHTAFYSPDRGVEWSVLALLLGMMLIVAVLLRTGAFDALGLWAAQASRRRPFRLLTILVIVTAVASSLLDNVTTVLLVAPVTLSVCRQLGLAPEPFLIAEAMASNIGGAATLVGDPPNLIVAARADLSYTDFLVHLAPLVVVLLAVFLLICRLMFRDLLVPAEEPPEVDDWDPKSTITDPRLLRISLVVIGLVTVMFVLHTWLHIEPALPALVGGLVLMALSRHPYEAIAKDVEWPTLVFFAGLFVMVGALVHTGVLATISELLSGAVVSDSFGAAALLLWGSALLSAVVDNIPYVTSAAPVVDHLAGPASGGSPDPLWWALALGADLGGNATIIGAAANVVVAGIAAHAGHPIGFWRFARFGIPVTLATVGVSTLYLWLRYFAWA